MRSLGAAFLIAAFLLAGCQRQEGTAPKSEYISLKSVPENVMKTAREKLPDVTFEKAWKTRKGNWEVQGKQANGKVRDIQVTPAGEVVEVD